MTKDNKDILRIRKLGFPWATRDPFLFCVYHADAYPVGNDLFGPACSLEGRSLGNDFTIKDGWRMYHGQTYQEYQRTQFGGWPWPKHDMVHPKEKGRFAFYANGQEDIPD